MIVHALKKFLRDEQPNIIFFMETKMTDEEMRKINITKFFFHGSFSVDCEITTRARRGGLCTLRRDSVTLRLVSYSLHHIVGIIVGSEREKN